MIFQHTHHQIPTGEKTATRRKLKQGQRVKDGVLYSCTGRKLHWVGQTVSVQPGRGKASVGRVTITALYKQKIGDITDNDAMKEGLRPGPDKPRPFTQFVGLWLEIHRKIDIKETVVVIEFVPVNAAQEQAK